MRNSLRWPRLPRRSTRNGVFKFMAREPIPKLVSKLRFLCKDHPLNAQALKDAANLILFTNKSLGTPQERWELTGAYHKGARLHHYLTGKVWLGEEKGAENA